MTKFENITEPIFNILRLIILTETSLFFYYGIKLIKEEHKRVYKFNELSKGPPKN